MKQTKKLVLDPCCGSRKFYFDKHNELVLFGDIRNESYVQCDGRTLRVCPDMLMDVTKLPFDDESYYLVVLDPPHLKYAGENSFLRQSYGVLPQQHFDFIRKAFCECWRVLKPCGTLIFKWNTEQVPLKDVLTAIPVQPMIGERRPNGKTFWLVFFKAFSTRSENFCLSCAE